MTDYRISNPRPTPSTQDERRDFWAAYSDGVLRADHTFPAGYGGRTHSIRQSSDRYTLHKLVSEVHHHATRTARHVRQDPDEDYRLFVPTHGLVISRQGEKEGLITPGMAALTTPSAPMEFTARGLMGHILKIPAHEINDALNLRAPTSARLDVRSGHGMMLADMIASVSRWRAELTAFDFDTRCADLVNLICKTLTRDGLLSRAERGLLASIARRQMRHRIHTDGGRTLSPLGLAADLGWSLRTVQEAMKEAGTTYTEMLREERLAEAYRRLSSPQFGHQAVADIADACGFSSVGHFGTVFRARYGETPKAVQQRMRGAALGVR